MGIFIYVPVPASRLSRQFKAFFSYLLLGVPVALQGIRGKQLAPESMSINGASVLE